jgi:hypothetical protein
VRRGVDQLGDGGEDRAVVVGQLAAHLSEMALGSGACGWSCRLRPKLETERLAACAIA